MDEVLPVLRREQVGECFGEAVMDIVDFVQPFRNRGWREPQAQVPQDDSVDDGRVRMERRVELAGEGRFDPAGSDEKLFERLGEVEAVALGSRHEREVMRLPRLGGAPDAVEAVEGPSEFWIVVKGRIGRDEFHDLEVFRESGSDFRQSRVDFLADEYDRHEAVVNSGTYASYAPR